MNRRILLFLLLIFLVGCDVPLIEKVELEEHIEKIDMDSITEEHTTEVLEIQETEETQEYEEETVPEVVEESPDEIEKVVVTQEAKLTGYAFDTLSQEEQDLYLEILEVLQVLGEDVTVSTLDMEKIDQVFQCVMLDHPEIFYVDGYTYTQYTKDDVLQKITFTGIYLYEEEEITRRNQAIIESANALLSGIGMNATSYEKVKYVYETVIDTCQYQLESNDSQNICSVLLNHESVCQGYAKTIQYLLQQLDVTVALVVGTVGSGEGHVWNLVQIDGEYYYVDATWGDASYTMLEETPVDMSMIPSINYDYLCITTDQLLETHRIDELVPMPYCSATQANYYVKEDLYFTFVDKEKITLLFQEAYDKQEPSVTLKCETREVYDEMIRYLIEEQGIFSYLQNQNTTIAYSDMEEQRSISFWL